MHTLCTSIITVALLAGSAIGVAAQSEEESPERILFVGNSFTFVENVDDQVEAGGVGRAAEGHPSRRLDDGRRDPGDALERIDRQPDP